MEGYSLLAESLKPLSLASSPGSLHPWAALLFNSSSEGCPFFNCSHPNQQVFGMKPGIYITWFLQWPGP